MVAQSVLLFGFYYVPRRSVTPLLLSPPDCVKRLDHLSVGGVFALFSVFPVLLRVVITTAVINVVLYSYRVGGACRALPNFFFIFPVLGW